MRGDVYNCWQVPRKQNIKISTLILITFRPLICPEAKDLNGLPAQQLKAMIANGADMKFLPLVIIGFVLIGCLGQTNGPSISTQWEKTSVDVINGNYSEEYVGVILTRQDNDSTPFEVTLTFHNKDNIYAVDGLGNRIENLTSRPMVGKGVQDILQFKVFGSSNTATGSDVLTVDLEINETIIISQNITVNIG
jgi:hypothetical protein